MGFTTGTFLVSAAFLAGLILVALAIAAKRKGDTGSAKFFVRLAALLIVVATFVLVLILTRG